MPFCLIGLGSNLQDRAALLRQAVLHLAALPDTRLVAQSSMYATAPVGGPAGQGEFLNAAVLVQTTLAPQAMLAALLDIETTLGRVRNERWGARTMDLDLLLYDEERLATPDLTLPHPRLAFRRFVLAGAAEIAPQMRHPEIGWTLARLWEHLNTAPNYVALAGSDPVFRRELAQRVAREAPARTILLPESQAEAIDTIRQAGELLPASDSISAAISDFWFEELVGQLAAALPESARVVLESDAQRLRPCMLKPKLLVRLDAGGLEGTVTRFEGPQLRLPGVGLEAAAIETTAAIQAMQ